MLDERQELNAGRAALIALTVVILGALGVLVWEYVRTKDVSNTGAIVVLLGGSALFLLIQRMFGAEAPRSLLGAELPTGPDAAARRTRRRSYLVDAVVTAAGLTGLTVAAFAFGDPAALELLPLPVAGTAGLVLAGAVEFVVILALTYGLNLGLGESQSRSVERRLARLESAE